MPVNTNRVASIILGGGEGKRLYPLTRSRCKPAISFAGRYLLIDIPISNSLNSHIHKIFVLTQFLSSPLNRHILDTYRLSTFSQGFIEVLGPEQKPERKLWYEGTADAVRKNLEYFRRTPVDYFIILSGDQLYRMNFLNMLSVAQNTGADLTIATLPVKREDAKRMGVLRADKRAHITDFYEKPQEDEILDRFRVDPSHSLLTDSNIQLPGDDCYLASMGIYVFKRQALFDLLEKDDREDFGKHLIPTQIDEGNVSVYLHDGYWEDIGTVSSYYHANLAMTKANPGLNCYDELNTIYSSHYHLPGPKIYNSHINSSIICEGSIVEAESISNSILGTRSVVQGGTVIKDSYIAGNDFYAHPIPSGQDGTGDRPYIGKNCHLDKVVLDRNVILGNGVKLINSKGLNDYDSENVFIRDGIIVVKEGACLPDGFEL
ncbi:Glucose-1-phosphate adenylyltransferase [Chlamydiales bacterium SCGC AG-110-M15]|nr:Glucose-1-phosphate adenylyltransferase [Chlamydiales bacterium SCGC AG-110-M15]